MDDATLFFQGESLRQLSGQQLPDDLAFGRIRGQLDQIGNFQPCFGQLLADDRHAFCNRIAQDVRYPQFVDLAFSGAAAPAFDDLFARIHIAHGETEGRVYLPPEQAMSVAQGALTVSVAHTSLGIATGGIADLVLDVVAGDGPANRVATASEAESLKLLPGRNLIEGTLDTLLGDTIPGFGADDAILITDRSFTRANVSVDIDGTFSNGTPSARFAISPTGHGGTGPVKASCASSCRSFGAIP